MKKGYGRTAALRAARGRSERRRADPAAAGEQTGSTSTGGMSCRSATSARRSPARRRTWCWPTTRCPASTAWRRSRSCSQHSPDMPFIFVSGSLGEERAIEALKSGATDYVLKDRLQRLPAVVKRALTEARERRERRQARSRARRTARAARHADRQPARDHLRGRHRESRRRSSTARCSTRSARRREQVLGRPLVGSLDGGERRRHRGAGGHDDAHRPRAHRPGARVDLGGRLGALVHLHACAAARSRHGVGPGVHGAGSHRAARRSSRRSWRSPIASSAGSAATCTTASARSSPACRCC